MDSATTDLVADISSMGCAAAVRRVSSSVSPSRCISNASERDASALDFRLARASSSPPLAANALQHTRQLSAIHHDFKRMRIPPATETA
ncbi:MAG: hypothetical protein ABS937_02415 [Stenotrophomonas sp.]